MRHSKVTCSCVYSTLTQHWSQSFVILKLHQIIGSLLNVYVCATMFMWLKVSPSRAWVFECEIYVTILCSKATMCMHSGKHVAHKCSFFMYSCSTYIKISPFHALKLDSSPFFLCKFLRQQESNPQRQPKPESDEKKEKLGILRNFNSSNDEGKI